MSSTPAQRLMGGFTSCFCLVLVSYLVLGQNPSSLDPALAAKIDEAASHILGISGVPSASLAIVMGSQIVYLKAYGDSRLEPRTAARPEMRYSLGSISKQFTATAILLLAEDGKLSLDDRVSRFIPNLSRAGDVSIRQLLSHTSGYQDYWPQDYVPPFMLQPVTSEKILDLWARKPLDFEPGTQWQYSNTNFVIAGLIVEKISGMPLLQFLQSRIFRPLTMQSVLNVDQSRLGDTDATGYTRYALGPLRVAPKEGQGWLFAAGELAMTAEDLAKWDLSLINETLLKPASYREMEREVCLKNGLCTRYGLGVALRLESGQRSVSHGGEVSGFTAENMVFPDAKTAIVVLTNQDSVDASGALTRQITPLLLQHTNAAKQQRDRKVLEDLQHGNLNRSWFTANANSYFTNQAIQDFASSLGRLGSPIAFNQTAQQDRGGMIFRLYKVQFQQKSVDVWLREMPDGKIEQYQVVSGD
jgi:D-alanyl-D-alanine carboxypeptidase